MSQDDASLPRYRSNAVARMIRMPVATLRIWERRYQITAPATTAAGHRLYSANDVRRLALLKQLTGLGHAISALAGLNVQQLQQVAQTHAATQADRQGDRPDDRQGRPLPDAAALPSPTVPPRRYDDATLADLAGLSSTIACECPAHVAELLMRLSAFEAYSADCQQRSPADAALHASLHGLAGTARAMFEAALEQIAIHEGLLLPGEPRQFR